MSCAEKKFALGRYYMQYARNEEDGECCHKKTLPPNGNMATSSPKDSTVGSFFTMAFLLATRMEPSAKVTVTTIGRPSGIAATAKLGITKNETRNDMAKTQP